MSDPLGGGASPATTTAPTPDVESTLIPVDCTFTVSSSMSNIIPTVAVVATTTTLADLDDMHIDFGLDTNYGHLAPIDFRVAAPETLLLGMKPNSTYHFRVVAQSGGTVCISSDYTVATGARPSQIKMPKVSTYTEEALYGGYIVTEGYKSTPPDDYAYILDADGEVVWWYRPAGFSDLTATKMSYDGKYMWIAHGNVPQVVGRMGRVAMDGTGFEDYSSEFAGLNHDFAVLPDESVVFIAYGAGGCDDIKERKPDGTVQTIINSGKVLGDATSCHCNAVAYDKSDDTVVVSEDYHSAYFKVDRQGNVKWVLGGGSFNSFDQAGGGASTWTGEHGLHILGLDYRGIWHLLFFNNGTTSVSSFGTRAVVRQLALDLNTMTTREEWTYDATPSIANAVMGDVQRLENGSTLVTYSLAGTIQEVAPSGMVLQQLTWGGVNGSVGYATKRKSLYGPPPR